MSHKFYIGQTNKYTNSTKQSYSSYGVINVKFKEGSDLIRPTILIKLGYGLHYWNNKNYMIWEMDVSTKFYYWITGAKAVNNGIYEISLELDHLATYKTAIGNQDFVISRCNDENQYNLYDNDDIFPPTNKNWDAVKIQIGNATGFTYRRNVAPPGEDPEYLPIGVITFYGKDGVKNVITEFIDITLEDLMQPSNLWDVVKYGFTQPGNFIKSALILPFDPDILGGQVNYKIGNESVTLSLVSDIDEGNRMYYKDGSASISQLIASISIFNDQNPDHDNLDDYRRFNDNYVQLAVKMPFVGVVQVPSDILSYDKIYWRYEVDIITGTGEAVLYVSKSGNTVQRLLHKASVRMGASIPITSTTSALIPLVQNAVAKNAFGVMDNMLNPTDITMTGSQDSVGYWDIGSVDLLVNIRQCDNIKAYRNIKGVPTNKLLKIKDLDGESDNPLYVEVFNPSIKISGCQKEIIEKINNDLANGIYYE